MNKVLSKILGLFCILMILAGSCVLADNEVSLDFYVSKFSMKLGDSQAISTIVDPTEVDISKITSSNPSVVAIRDNYKLKALSTGVSTLSYKYLNKDGEEKEMWCHVEVTTGNSTYAPVVENTVSKIKITLELGDYSTVIESAVAAIPKLPEVTKEGYVLEGWYKDANYLMKLGERDRFNKDTTLYAKWITSEEANKSTVSDSSLYDDINGHWARYKIEAVTYSGLFNGVSDRMFGPEKTMTRAMVITVLGRLDKVELTGRTTTFTDVPTGAYYEEYVAWGLENKIVSGTSETEFSPNKEITREEMAVMMANYIKYKGFEYELNELDFTDSELISSWAVESVKILNDLGIMQGNSNGTYNPKKVATRAEIATIFFNYLNYIEA